VIIFGLVLKLPDYRVYAFRSFYDPLDRKTTFGQSTALHSGDRDFLSDLVEVTFKITMAYKLAVRQCAKCGAYQMMRRTTDN
jgi:hypothetical protein